MDNLSIFKNMNPDEISDALKSLGARRITFRKEHIIISNLVDDDLIGVIISGKASIVNYGYSGNRDIIDNLEYDDVFGKPFFNINSDVVVIASTDCEVLFIDYNLLISHGSKYDKINYNINKLLTGKIYNLYEKIEILSKRTIKEKLLTYFNNLSKKYHKKSFNLPIDVSKIKEYFTIAS